MALLDTRPKDIRNLPGFGLTATLAVALPATVSAALGPVRSGQTT